MDRVIEIYFFDSTQVVRRPLLVLTKASEYFKSYFLGPLGDSEQTQYHVKDFSREQFMMLMPFIDDPFQIMLETEIFDYFGMKTVSLEKTQVVEKTLQPKITTNDFFPYCKYPTDISFYRQTRERGNTGAMFHQRDCSVEDDCIFYAQKACIFQITPGDDEMAFQFVFAWPHLDSTDHGIQSIQLLDIEKKQIIIEFDVSEISFYEKKGYDMALLPMYESFTTALLVSHARYALMIKSENMMNLKMTRMLYTTIKLENYESKRMQNNSFEFFHMVPKRIASLNLAQSQSVTVSIENEHFNTIYFRLMTGVSQKWNKNHLPQFHNARLVATVEASLMIPLNSWEAFSYEICKKINDIISPYKPPQEFNRMTIENWEDWFEDDPFFIHLEFEKKSIIAMFKLEEKLAQYDSPWNKLFASFERDFGKMKDDFVPSHPLSKKMVLFDQSLWSLVMHHDLKKPAGNELFEHDEKGLTLGFWRMDAIKDMAKFSKCPRIENMESITFEVQGDTCVEPIHVDVIINGLMLERIDQGENYFPSEFSV
jgi:hypothetical protein